VVDIPNKVVKRIVALPGYPGGAYGMALSPNGRYLLVAQWGANQVAVLDRKTWALELVVPVGRSPLGVAILDDSTAAVSNSNEDSISLVKFDRLHLVR
jgi:YVTN family beta-propeller protein